MDDSRDDSSFDVIGREVGDRRQIGVEVVVR